MVHQNSFKGVISTRRSQASQGISSNKSTVPLNQSNINAPVVEGLNINQSAKKSKVRKDEVIGQ
jgi:hypothetical protein